LKESEDQCQKQTRDAESGLKSAMKIGRMNLYATGGFMVSKDYSREEKVLTRQEGSQARDWRRKRTICGVARGAP
jgi:hypothetical protein